MNLGHNFWSRVNKLASIVFGLPVATEPPINHFSTESLETSVAEYRDWDSAYEMTHGDWLPVCTDADHQAIFEAALENAGLSDYEPT